MITVKHGNRFSWDLDQQNHPFLLFIQMFLQVEKKKSVLCEYVMKTASLLYCTFTLLIGITIKGKSKKVKYVSFKSCIFKLYYSPQQFGTPLQNLPHIFSEMFSSSADRKQFHLQENSMPPLPPLPQHHHHPLLLFSFLPLSPFHSSSTLAGCWDTTLGFVVLHSIFPHQKKMADQQKWD